MSKIAAKRSIFIMQNLSIFISRTPKQSQALLIESATEYQQPAIQKIRMDQGETPSARKVEARSCGCLDAPKTCKSGDRINHFLDACADIKIEIGESIIFIDGTKALT